MIRPGTRDYRRLSIAIVMAGFSTFSLLYGVQPLLPEFASSFGLTAAGASAAVSSATGPMAIALLFAPIIANLIGRRAIILSSLSLAALLGVVVAATHSWSLFLVLRGLSGIALAGVPAIAMAYIAEEVEPAAVPQLMGRYIAGVAFGGMFGRVGVAWVAHAADWRIALGVMGGCGLVAAGLFAACAPAAGAGTRSRVSPATEVRSYRAAVADPALNLLYLESFLVMGAFVSLFNFIGFKLSEPPFALGQAEIGTLFLLYLFGSVSSLFFGRMASRLGFGRVLWRPVLIVLVGTLVTLSNTLWVIVIGVGIATIGFFGAHSVASSWVSHRAGVLRGHASALYLVAYYLGSSVLGTLSGVAWDRGGWSAVVLFVGALCMMALIASLLVARRSAGEPSPDSGFAGDEGAIVAVSPDAGRDRSGPP